MRPLRPMLAVLCIASLLYTGCAATVVPTDAQQFCTDVIPSGPAFNTWFESGTIALDGVVKPADSVLFPDSPNCSFYQWSEQMFLWLTSPAPPRYGGGGRIFNSPSFYDVSPLDANFERTLIPHVNGIPRDFTVRFMPGGPNGFPIMFSKVDSKIFELEPTPTGPTGKPLVLLQGRPVEINRIAMSEKGTPLFFDTSGRAMERVTLLSRAKLRKELVIQKFVVEQRPFFLNFFGEIVEVEQGQAFSNGVLQARTGSLVYYTIVVNDVFAYFMTGAKNGAFVPGGNQFPTDQADLDQVINFATANGKTLVDPEALAIEAKLAWVETAGLANPDRYIKTTARIPTYDTSDPSHWVKTGDKVAELALVGVHVVGSTAGHPEMIWATFEHENNMPNEEYRYIRNDNTVVTVPRDTTGSWLFCSAGSNGPFNEQHMTLSAPDIVAEPSFTITPSDTIRWKAWGGAFDQSPNPIGGGGTPSARSNTEIISINHAIRTMLTAGDVRKNYIMTGATWTIGGAVPSGSFPNENGGFGNEVGTSKLANGTMETYQQGSNGLYATGTNCFTCHASNTTDVSFVYGPLKPLF